MGKCQENNKSSAKIVNLSQGDLDILFTELTLYLFAVAGAQEQGLPNIHDDVESEFTLWRYDSLEFFAVIALSAMATSELRDMGMKLADGH